MYLFTDIVMIFLVRWVTLYL